MSQVTSGDSFVACRCGGDMKITAEPAAHDDTLLDIVVECEACGRVLNNFVNIEDCSVVPT